MDIETISDALKSPFLYTKDQQRQARDEAIELLTDARKLINHAVDIMSTEQLGSLAGVREWIERA